MYTLRLIEEFKVDGKLPWQQSVSNFELGNGYTLFKGFHPILLKARDGFEDVETKEKLLCLIHGENKREFNIWNSDEHTKRTYFIMTDSGQTFERL